MQIDDRFRFDNFVVGSASRLAVAAARAVAELPGTVYNPLFIYSSSGLGKTHLAGAIAHRARELRPDLAVAYLTLDEFVEELHAAVSAGRSDAFKARFQQVDLLLIDDVQFLTGRRETQSEILRLFNALQGSGRQIVMTSDRPPSEIADVDERLLTRLTGGLIVDIDVPDYETRVAILRNKCDERGVHFRQGVLEELAQIGFGNVRELQGALNRLVVYQGLGEAEVMPADVRALVGDRSSATPIPAVAASIFAPTSGGEGEYSSFLADVAEAVAQHVDGWRIRLAEAVTAWSGEGYRVAVLERAMQLPKAPDLDGLLATFAGAVAHLRELELRAGALDPAVAGHEMFRDPERVPEAQALVERLLAGTLPPPAPDPALTRATFEMGAGNQLAVRAVDGIAEEPGRRYNPLFIVGPPGSGKTHLLHAVGNELLEASGGALVVACLSAEQFVDELINALQEGLVEQWRARYRAVDVLCIDDVHAVAGKERSQEELFHLFNELSAAGKQVVLTADRAPGEIAGLEERLRSRFGGGLVVALQPPERALRERLYARFLDGARAEGEPELLGYLAERPAASVREVVALAQRLATAAATAGVPLTLRLARVELEGSGAAAPVGDARAGLDALFLDEEKVVWEWPDVGGRLIEELR